MSPRKHHKVQVTATHVFLCNIIILMFLVFLLLALCTVHITVLHLYIQLGHVTYIRKPVAPSIPFPGRSFGYEEDEYGDLKPQQIPDRDTTMGPAYYDALLVSVVVHVCVYCNLVHVNL